MTKKQEVREMISQWWDEFNDENIDKTFEQFYKEWYSNPHFILDIFEKTDEMVNHKGVTKEFFIEYFMDEYDYNRKISVYEQYDFENL